jgi:2-(1,2-epoxy-1,2-dihydrophenyl)acetyl-CoA isomerase
MKQTVSIPSINDFFTLEKKASHTIIIRLNDCPFHYGADLTAKDNFLKGFDLISRDEDVKTVLLFGPETQNGCDRFFEACRQSPSSGQENVSFERLQNAVSQYVTKIAGLNKIVVHIDPRKSIPLFMNLGLCCDYRIVCDQASFHSRNLEMGYLPKGGEIYFLNRIIGFKKTLNIFLFGKEISALKALHMGFVDEVVPFNKLEDAALDVASQISKKPSYILAGIKSMMNQPDKGIADSLEQEKNLCSMLISSKKFRKEVEVCHWNVD